MTGDNDYEDDNGSVEVEVDDMNDYQHRLIVECQYQSVPVETLSHLTMETDQPPSHYLSVKIFISLIIQNIHSTHNIKDEASMTT